MFQKSYKIKKGFEKIHKNEKISRKNSKMKKCLKKANLHKLNFKKI